MSFKSPESLFACTVALSTCNTAASCRERLYDISEVIKLFVRATKTTVGSAF